MISSLLLIIGLVGSSFGVRETSDHRQMQDLSDEMVSSLNGYFSEKRMPTFVSSKLENIRTIDSTDSETSYILFDLKGESGFILSDGEKRILSYRTEGDFPALLEPGVSYSETESTFFDSDRVAITLRNKENAGVSDSSWPIVNGRLASIEYEEAEQYLRSEYIDSPWIVGTSGKLSGLPLSSASDEGYVQTDGSIYLVVRDRPSYEEGNCAINTIANGFAYLSEYGGLDNLPDRNATTWVNPSLENYYNPSNCYVGDGWFLLNYIYATVRSKAYEREYNPYEGLLRSRIHQVIRDTAEEFGYESDAPACNTAFSKSDVVGYISSGVPVYLSLDEDARYGDHGVMITGYRDYLAPVEIATFLVVFNVFCVSVYDGWTNVETWIDLSSSIARLSGSRNNETAIVPINVF